MTKALRTFISHSNDDDEANNNSKDAGTAEAVIMTVLTDSGMRGATRAFNFIAVGPR